MLTRNVTLNSSADLVAFAAESHQEGVHTNVYFGSDFIEIPYDGTNYPYVQFTERKDLVFYGASAPSKKALIHGGALVMMSCERVAFQDIGFRLQPSPIDGGGNHKFEVSWKPFKIHASDPSKPSRNITVIRCSFSGHYDEIEVGPADHATWYATSIFEPAARDIIFSQCMFGPSFVNPTRGNHNFGISAALVDGLVINDTVLVGSNRRNPQINARKAKISHCVIDNWGTMALGITYGSDIEVNACHFIRGASTFSLERPISMVESTSLASPTGFGEKGPARIAITPNCVEYNTSFVRTTNKGWNCFYPIYIGSGSSNDYIFTKKSAAFVEPLKPWLSIVQNAGCRDALDVAITRELASGNHIPWISDYTASLPWPGP